MNPAPGVHITANVRLSRPLGRGGMGNVWAAEHLALGIEVAVKLIALRESRDEDTARARFVREARAAAQIHSAHVVQTYDYGICDDGTPYIIMQLLEGETLAERLERGPLTSTELSQLIDGAAKGLTAAHERNIVHRDIKPANLFLGQVDGQLHATIVDFGIAKQLGHLPDGDLTQTGALVGSPHYMSPEQLLYQNDVDHRTDLWSLGVVAYEALLGARPFRGETVTALSMAICNGSYEPPSIIHDSLPPAVDRWFERALAVAPEERFANAAELAEAWHRVMDGVLELSPVPVVELSAPLDESTTEDSLTLPPQHAPRVASTTRLARTLSWLSALAAALLLPLAGWRYFSEGDESDTADEANPPTPAPVEAPPSRSAASDSAATVNEVSAVKSAATAEWTATAELPAGMVLVPGGAYPIGCNSTVEDDCFEDEDPVHRVEVRPFAIQRYETTVGEYQACVAAGACPTPERDGGACNAGRLDRAEHPMNCVSWAAARAFCAFRNARLPTEFEWEVAARGSDQRPQPWGSDPPSCALAVISERGHGCGSGRTLPVGARPLDRSPFGVYDLAGNVREWTSSDYRPYPGGTVHPFTNGKVNRGGSFEMTTSVLSSAYTRLVDPADEERADLGFRCAIDLPGQTTR